MEEFITESLINDNNSENNSLIETVVETVGDFCNSIFDNTSTALTFSTINHDDSYRNFEISKFKFKHTIDEKIIEICENIYNYDNNQVHKYTFMSTFLTNCMKLIEDILGLIERISTRISENGKCSLHEDFINNLEEELIKFFKKFNNECKNIVYFYYDEHGKKLLHDLCLLFSEHVKFDYSTKNFDNSELLYSDIQLTWTIIKFNLELYEKEKYEQYRNITYVKRKNIEWNIMKPLTDLLYPSSNQVTVKNDVKKVKKPVINNKIIWKDKVIKIDNNNELIEAH